MGLSVQDNHNVFSLYHMRGVHRGGGGIGHINQYVEFTPNSTIYQQTAGALTIVIEYINQMRSLGIYDNANIIIMADHGHILTPDTAFMVKRQGVSFDSMQINSAPVCHEDYWQTLVEIMGLNTTRDFGRSVFNIQEDEERLRVLSSFSNHPDWPNSNLNRNLLVRTSFTLPTYPRNILTNAGIRFPGRDLESEFLEDLPHIELVPMYDSFSGGGWDPGVNRAN